MIKYYCDTCSDEIKNPNDMRKLTIRETNDKPCIPEKLICVPCKQKVVKLLGELSK